MRWEEKVAQALTKDKKTIGIAESCSGGLLCHRLTNIPGSSRFLKGGIVAYHNTVKINVLGIPADIIRKHGAVCEAIAMQMARNVRRILKTDIGVGITGIAGPSGGTKIKPVGLVYIAIANGRNCSSHRCFFPGSRTHIKTSAVNTACRLILKSLE